MPLLPNWDTRPATLIVTIPARAASRFAAHVPADCVLGPVPSINGLVQLVVSLPAIGVADRDAIARAIAQHADSGAESIAHAPIAVHLLRQMIAQANGPPLSPAGTECIDRLQRCTDAMKDTFGLIAMDASGLPPGWPFPCTSGDTAGLAVVRIRSTAKAPADWPTLVHKTLGGRILQWGFASRKSQTHLRVVLNCDVDLERALQSLESLPVTCTVERIGDAATVTITTQLGPETTPVTMQLALNTARAAMGRDVNWESVQTHEHKTSLRGFPRPCFDPAQHAWGRFRIDGGVVATTYEPAPSAFLRADAAAVPYAARSQELVLTSLRSRDVDVEVARRVASLASQAVRDISKELVRTLKPHTATPTDELDELAKTVVRELSNVTVWSDELNALADCARNSTGRFVAIRVSDCVTAAIHRATLPVPDFAPTRASPVVAGAALLDDHDDAGDVEADCNVTPDGIIAHILKNTAGAVKSDECKRAAEAASRKMHTADVANDYDRACLAAAHFALEARSGNRPVRHNLRSLDSDALARHLVDALEREHAKCPLPRPLPDLVGRVKAKLCANAHPASAESAGNSEHGNNGDGQTKAPMDVG